MAIRSGPKRIISTSSELELLEMVLELDIGRCGSEDARLPRGWIVRSHIDWKRERSIPYKGVKTSL